MANQGSGAAGWIGAGLGLLSAGAQWASNRKRRKEAREAMVKQHENQQELNEQQKQHQLDIWNQTNYPQQIEQMKEAGLNPALMYGMAGGGSATTGSVGAGAAGIATGGDESVGMGLNPMMAAQVKLAESQARKNEVEADKIESVDTAKTEMEITDLAQGVENKKAQEQLLKVQTRIQEVEADLAEWTQDGKFHYLGNNYAKAQHELDILRYDHSISAETAETKIKIVKQEYTNLMIQAELMNSNIDVNNAEIKKKIAETSKLIMDIAWRQEEDYNVKEDLRIKNKQADIAKVGNEIKQQFANTYGVQVASEVVDKIIDIAMPFKKGIKNKWKNHDKERGVTIEKEWEYGGGRKPFWQK